MSERPTAEERAEWRGMVHGPVTPHPLRLRMALRAAVAEIDELVSEASNTSIAYNQACHSIALAVVNEAYQTELRIAAEASVKQLREALQTMADTASLPAYEQALADAALTATKPEGE